MVLAEAAVRVDKKRILVVEDDPEMIMLHRDFLSDSYSVLIEPSGKQALRSFRKNPDLHLAVIDFMLPDMSGLDVLKQIKKISPCIPAIFITAYGNEDVAVKAFRCGARDYVKKPFAYDELMRRIDFCLSLNEIDQGERTALLNESPEPYGQAVARRAPIKNYSIQEICRYIQNNYATDITLEHAAGRAGLSKYHFSRTFKEKTGFTFQMYLHRTRIEHSKTLLADPALSITEVGYCVGYPDLTQFERIFRKLADSTPTDFRDQLRERKKIP